MALTEFNKGLEFDIPEEYLKSTKLQSMLAKYRFLINNRNNTVKQIELEIDSARAGNKDAKSKVLDWKIRLKAYDINIAEIEKRIRHYCNELSKAEQELGL